MPELAKSARAAKLKRRRSAPAALAGSIPSPGPAASLEGSSLGRFLRSPLADERSHRHTSVALAELARELAASDSSYALKPVAGEGPGKVHAPEALCRRAAGPHSVESVSKKLRSLV